MNVGALPIAAVTTNRVPRPGLWQWLRQRILATPTDIVLAALLLGIAIYAAPAVLRWAVADSVVVATDPKECATIAGACWAVVTVHARTIFFGLYPYTEHWRAGLALAVVAIALALSFTLGATRLRTVMAVWAVATVLFVSLMGGGVFGLSPVATDSWGGLPLSIFVFMATVIVGFPLAIVLALGRGSQLPAIRMVCTAAIETVRAVPILTILFCAAIVVPLMLPDWLTPGKIYRVIFAMAFFYACFQAEIIRGGMQGVPSGQLLAAFSLGLTPTQAKIYVQLPQALRYTVPATINQMVVALKDTSMLLVVGLFDFMASANTAITKDEWGRYFVELYLFVAVTFLFLSSVLSSLELRFVGKSKHG